MSPSWAVCYRQLQNNIPGQKHLNKLHSGLRPWCSPTVPGVGRSHSWAAAAANRWGHCQPRGLSGQHRCRPPALTPPGTLLGKDNKMPLGWRTCSQQPCMPQRASGMGRILSPGPGGVSPGGHGIAKSLQSIPWEGESPGKLLHAASPGRQELPDAGSTAQGWLRWRGLRSDPQIWKKKIPKQREEAGDAAKRETRTSQPVRTAATQAFRPKLWPERCGKRLQLAPLPGPAPHAALGRYSPACFSAWRGKALHVKWGYKLPSAACLSLSAFKAASKLRE